ncbi:MAG: T9SS type B sorting domain-containing protein [Flavobacteriaceae bacterium]
MVKKVMRPKTFIFFLFIPLLLCSLNAQAQLESYLIDNEAWVKANFVEIGVNSKGVFGNNTANRPPSFHDNRETANLLFGFIANPLKDNWVDYDGDFFTPGSPEEGFTIQVGGVNYSNNNTDFLSEIEGGIVDVGIVESDCFESSAKIDWEGSVADLTIKRSYSVTENGLFIQMITSISNTSSETKNDVYFMHNVDPDNNVTLTGDYATNLEIISQPSSANNIAMVKATQNAPDIPTTLDMDGSAVSFYANDPKARVTFGNFNNRNASDVWNASFGFTNTVGSTENSDLAISIAFKLDNIAPNETKTFVYYYILEEIDDSFTPLIVNITPTSPSTCGGSDGSILFSGLDENEDYIISYQRNGVSSGSITYTADSNGFVQIPNLGIGTYSDFDIEYNGCSTIVNSTYELSDPSTPIAVASGIDPTNCDGDNGQVVLTGLIANQDIEITYDADGVSMPISTISTNSSGELIIDNLVNGEYSNFNLRYISTDCSASNTSIIILNGTFPSISVGTILSQAYCDADLDYVTEINLSPLDVFALDGLSSADYTVSYHESLDDANNNVAVSKTNYETNGSPNYDLFVRVENNTSGCFETGTFSITINIPVDFDINYGYLCLLSDDTVDPDFNFPIETGLNSTDYTFQWFFNNTLLPNTESSLIPSGMGNYSVEVTTVATGCSIRKDVDVVTSGKPRTIEIILESGLFTDIITVSVQVSGLGNYEYRIDDEPYQSSSLFENVPAGNHRFYIRDINGCGEIMVEKLAINYPRFFTPNNDSFNDTWYIKDIESLREPTIHIFNRYGKLLKVLTKDSEGWDGMYAGKKQLGNDYWFIISYNDENGVRRKFQAHFALKR